MLSLLLILISIQIVLNAIWNVYRHYVCVYQLTLLFPMCYYFELVLKLISHSNSANIINLWIQYLLHIWYFYLQFISNLWVLSNILVLSLKSIQWVEVQRNALFIDSSDL